MRKNGVVINLTKPVYIDHDYSYMPQSFLLNVLDIDTVLIEMAEESHRVNEVYLATNTTNDDENLTIVSFDESAIAADLLSLDEKERKILLAFAIGTDHGELVKSNESTIKDVIYTSLQNIAFETYEAILSHTFRDELSTNIAEAINDTLNIHIVKYFYITDLVIQG